MSIFRRGPRPKYVPPVLQMSFGRTWVEVTPRAADPPRVYLGMMTGGEGCGGSFTEDEARMIAQALLDGIQRSKALTARQSG